MLSRPIRRVALFAACLFLAGSAAAVAADRPVPARHAIARRTADSPLRIQPVDWSGYRGIRRYAYYPYGAYGPPLYYPRPYYGVYAPYPPFYYGHYYHRPWYAAPYAYNFAYRYPPYAPRYYGYGPLYSWHAPLAAPLSLPYSLPQVSSTLPPGEADETGKFYW